MKQSRTMSLVESLSGLEFWAEVDPKEVASTIWRLWQSGSRYHWAWPCPHCQEYLIPRFKCLAWEKPVDAHGRELRSDTALAARTAHLVCPRNGCIIFWVSGLASPFKSWGERVCRGCSDWCAEQGASPAARLVIPDHLCQTERQLGVRVWCGRC